MILSNQIWDEDKKALGIEYLEESRGRSLMTSSNLQKVRAKPSSWALLTYLFGHARQADFGGGGILVREAFQETASGSLTQEL